jgi:hypothetical protein
VAARIPRGAYEFCYPGRAFDSTALLHTTRYIDAERLDGGNGSPHVGGVEPAGEDELGAAGHETGAFPITR